MENWTFLTNYGHVLLCIAADPEIRMKDVADKVGITERATQRIVADLLAAGLLSTGRRGCVRRYRCRPPAPRSRRRRPPRTPPGRQTGQTPRVVENA